MFTNGEIKKNSLNGNGIGKTNGCNDKKNKSMENDYR